MVETLLRLTPENLRTIANSLNRQWRDADQVYNKLTQAWERLDAGWDSYAESGINSYYSETMVEVVHTMGMLSEMQKALEMAADKLEAADLRAATFFDLEAFGFPPGDGHYKGYIVPPLGPFEFHFHEYNLDIDRFFNFGGWSLEDLAWTEELAKLFDWAALTLDGAGVIASGVSLIPEIGRVPSIIDILIGVYALDATIIADILQGETGFIVEDDGTLGFALGKDTFVAYRNFLAGTIFNVASIFSPPGGWNTLFSAASMYVSLSQFKYDIESQMELDGGGQIIFSGLDAESRAKAWEQIEEQLLDDWFFPDLSPGLEAWAADQAAEGIAEIGHDVGTFIIELTQDISDGLQDWADEVNNPTP